MTSEINNCYVYVFKSTKNKKVKIDENIYDFNIGDVYYVGEGNDNRIKHMNRNIECNILTEKLNGKIEVVAENLTKQEALKLESQLIKEYKELGFLANKDEGNKNTLNKADIPIIKFLIELDRQGIIDMNYSDLEKETNTSRSSIYSIQDSVNYLSAIPKPPDNLLEILTRYKPLRDNNRLLGELKYFIELIDNGFLKMTYKDLYEKEYNTTHDKIKASREFPCTLRPSNEKIKEMIDKYGYHNKDEKEIRNGKILSCLNIKKQFNLKVSDLYIAELFDVSLNTVANVKSGKYKNIDPIEVDSDVLLRLFSFEPTYLIPDNPLPKNEKFEWTKSENAS